MDEERSATAISTEQPDNKDPDLPAPNTRTEWIAGSENSSTNPFSGENVAYTYTEPLILRVNGTPERLLHDDGDGDSCNKTLTTPNESITTQPAARSTPIHLTQQCQSQPGSPQRIGVKSLEHTHCSQQTHTALLHSIQSKPVRNGGSHRHPKLGSLPKGGSSTSSSSSAGPKHNKKLRSNPSITSQGSKRSKSSSKSNSSQIPTDAHEDCCVHCILSCLFCEFLTLCSIVLDCTTCGACAGDDSCFCCCCASEECGDCDLPCDMDCGIIDACCESADCLEICMECCSLCFSS